jgi:hypothetical protein
MDYFKKEVFSNPLRLPNGKTVMFKEVADDEGVLATEDGYLISELESAMRRRVGGVVRISADEFEELKKNPPGKPSQPLFPQELQQFVQPFHQTGRNIAAGAAGALKRPGSQTISPVDTSKVPGIEIPATIPEPQVERAAKRRRAIATTA